MSSSAVIAAKKRLETYLKKYEIPTVESAEETTTDKSGALLLSLLQSRLNWTSSVFTKYKADPIQQPKRATNSRKKWPNMKYLGTCDLELGPHLFEKTTFYEATRSLSWKSIAKSQGLDVPEDTVMQEATSEEPKPTAESVEPITEITETTTAPVTEATIAPETEATTAPETGATTPTIEEKEDKKEEDESEIVKFVDIVFELNEVPNERFVFPKESLISLSLLQEEETPRVLHASFLLPINTADDFFESPKNQILKFGKNCQLPYIQEFITMQSNKALVKEDKDTTTYHPTNIRMTGLDQVVINTIQETIHKPHQVKASMSIKLKSVPETKKYIKYNLSNDAEAQVQDLLKRSMTVPEIISGPIMAEKKRNEILNLIKLGKRSRDEKFEADLPKNKYANANAKEDGLLKCVYCSTKHTSMWRPGPAGHGTLCNACGYQWKRGEILREAPVLTLQEERQLIKEKKEKERLADALELEKEAKKGGGGTSKKDDASNKKLTTSQSKNKKQSMIPSHPPSNIPSPEPTCLIAETAEKKKSSTTKSTKATKTATVTVDSVQITQVPSSTNSVTIQQEQLQQSQQSQQPQPSPQSQQPQPQQPQAPIQNPFMLYSQGGIPLPTLFIDFMGSSRYAHPNCAVTLLDSHFHIRLCQGNQLCLVNLSKADLVGAQFDISSQQEGELKELLTMTISAIPNKSMDIFDKKFENAPIVIRFLEKLDPSGGAVVQRILQRWLVTVSQT